MDSEHKWSDRLPVVQVRVARVTTNLQAIIRFYHEGLGLAVVGSFQNHDGYSGVMLGLPGRDYHLEFTQHDQTTDLPAPNPDDLLVFYIPSQEAIGRLVVKLGVMGYRAVAPVNPYWENISVTIPDPDGRRIVLAETSGI